MVSSGLLSPLKTHPANPRYFCDSTGKAVYLTGSHTWSNLQEYESDSPFDYEAYLDFMRKHNHNFMRMWTWECGAGGEWLHGWSEDKRLVHPLPYRRASSGKFNLTEFDEEYFERLRSRVVAAGRQGIYVSIMLFQGWDVESKGRETNPFTHHPFNRKNNINDVDGDPYGTGEGRLVHTLKVPEVTSLQKAYVKKVVETVNDLDNVLYEISNESSNESVEWQYHMISFIHDLEKKLGKQHPVGMTVPWSPGSPGDNEDLFRSPAEWVSPNAAARNGYSYRYDPPPADGVKVVLLDTDHLWGIGGDASWVWKSFTRGYNPIFMDPYDSGYTAGGLTGLGLKDVGRVDTRWEPIRRAMGCTRMLAEKLNLAGFTLRPELAQTGYCLANPRAEYVVYVPREYPLTIWVDLSGARGSLRAEWLNPVTGEAAGEEKAEGGGKRLFTSPFSEDAVLIVRTV
ncbi:MAG: hypothetical protein FGF51_06455 [Candidatus Brockarchaeota archaeon]|nr:hypothetical protein [Candidatus Brockarchaeota archaeon]